MRVSPFVSGAAVGLVAGAVTSMLAAGAMLNPSVQRSAKHTVRKAEHAMHHAADNSLAVYWVRDAEAKRMDTPSGGFHPL